MKQQSCELNCDLLNNETPCNVRYLNSYNNRLLITRVCVCVQIESGGTECHLSDKTAEDAGQLDTATGRSTGIHHFEMKPLLGLCYILFLSYFVHLL